MAFFLLLLVFFVALPNQFRCLGIIGGKPAPEYPFFVKVEIYKYGYFCGGTLIAPDAVLTAAHCLMNKLKNRWAFPGEIFVVKTSQRHRYSPNRYAVIDYSLHYEFDRKFIEMSPYDIAVLKLQDCLVGVNEPNGFLEPCSAHEEGEEGQSRTEDYVTGYAIGYGLTSIDPHTSADRLMEIPLYNVPCLAHSSLSGERIDGKRQVCYGGRSLHEAESTCFGDFGGPLVHKGANRGEDGEFCIIGTSSLSSFTCRNHLAPSVFIRASFYAEWIEDALLHLAARSLNSCAIS